MSWTLDKLELLLREFVGLEVEFWDKLLYPIEQVGKDNEGIHDMIGEGITAFVFCKLEAIPGTLTLSRVVVLEGVFRVTCEE